MSLTIRKPNKIIYRLVVALCSLLHRKKYALEVRKSAGFTALKPPYIVLANHISNIDFTVVACAMSPAILNFVVATFYFRRRFLNGMLRLMGCVPKEQFQPDTKAIKSILSIIRRGDVVAIYPAGQSAYDGEATYMDASIAGLLKKLKVPVVTVHINGAFIACPKWNMGLRKSRIEASVDVLFTPHELETLNREEIYQKVKNALDFDDYEWQRKTMVKASKPHSAKGLEQVLYRCPRCQTEFNMHTQHNRLWCASCGNAALMNEYGLLQPADSSCIIFETPTQWSRWQMQCYKQQVESPAFSYSEPASLVKISTHGKYTKVGSGIAEINIDRFRYHGTYNDIKVSWEVKNNLSAIFAHEVKGHFDFAYNGEFFSIAPFNSASAFKFVALKEAIFEQYYSKNS
ncbi:MAG: 1-acyl-sn-glycerol-3-phosphate acyltransferase [Candidatus Azobacteroides sp.]|nr:1-acyl-sn-glycerol-3-phosphate acyltransferase [Candidatus Azobacteroides sp.]